MASLDKYRSNVYSQFGEDGVLKEICRRLNISTGYFVEFGAWDGKFLSNTFHLLEQGWRGVYIEGDREKYEQLCRNMIPYAEKVVLLNKFVRVDGPTKLDNILCEAHAPRDLELLSIDVDSNDWHIWLGLKTFQPKILVIEVISSIPAGVIQTHRGEDVLGSSFSAAIELGKLKGYTAVCHTGNIIFVRNELIPRLNLPEDELLFPELLFDYSWLKKPLVSAAPQSTKKTRLLSRLQSAHQQLRGILLRIRQRTPAKETITTTNSTSSQFFSSCADSTNQDYLHPPVDHPFYLHLLDLKTAVSSYASSDSLRILDFGAGTSPYRSLFPNSDYRRADLPGSPAVDYVVSAHSTIDEADEYFDLVISTQVLEHVETPELYLKEALRLLKPGGRLVLTTLGIFEEHGVPKDYWRWTALGMRKLIANSGFRIEEIKRLTCNPRAALFLTINYLPRFAAIRPWRSPHALVLWVVRKLCRRFRKHLHRLADSFFQSDAVCPEEDNSKSLYIALLVCATKQ